MDHDVPFLITVELNGGPELKKSAARLQIVARQFGFKPTWLVGPRTLQHPDLLEPLVRWQAEGEADLGAWLPAGEVPPLVELGGAKAARWPALTDFPESVMDEKLAWFTQAFEKVVGRHPTIIRTSRASVDDRYYALLFKLGYRIDLTVIPNAKIGPTDFSGYSEKAYMTPQGIFEVPRTVRRRHYGPLVEDLLVLPGFPGALARRVFPTLRCFRLRRRNRTVLQELVRESFKTQPEHLDLRISSRDWYQGESLVRELRRLLPAVQPIARGMTAEEYLLRFKNQQLRKGLV